MNNMIEKEYDDEDIIFNDGGDILNKNYNWTMTKGLVVDVDDVGTTLTMSEVGMYNYSPNILISGDFDLILDILMPNGGSFLSFGFSENQEEFVHFKGWWNANTFKKLNIKRVGRFIKYYLGGEFKGCVEVNSNELYFQFRIYSLKDCFEFTFKNFKIIKLNMSKESNEYLLDKIDNLEHMLDEVNYKFKEFEDNTNAILDSYHSYFNSIFVDHQLKPKKLLKFTQTLCLEILNFIGNVCKKYNLEYWLDSGNLLGAIRHGGYIPWDDDMDISMMREDYEQLLKVIQYEINNHGLDDVLSFRYNFETKPNWISTFAQIVCIHDDLIFGCVDIFPFDFLIEPSNNFDEAYNNARNKHYIKLVNGVSREEVFKEVYSNLNLTFQRTDKMIMGVECGIPGRYRVVWDSNKIFPLNYILFEDHVYPCPNDVSYYLSGYYSNFLEIPKIAEFHTRQKYLRKKRNVFEIYKNQIAKLKKVNDNF